MTQPLVIAHRGVHDNSTENTLAAFSAAIEAGADMIEFDVRRVRSGEMIAFHDSAIAGVPLGELTRKQIANSIGTEPALLSDIVKLCAGKIMLDVELKEDGYVGDVMDVVSSASMVDQVVVTSFLPTAVAEAKRLMPSVKTGLLVGSGSTRAYLGTRIKELYPVQTAKKIEADYIVPHLLLAKYGLLKQAWAAGFPCLVWTVNSEEQIRALAADRRVAGIITDRAALARSIVPKS